MLGGLKLTEEENASEFGDVLRGLLSNQQTLGIDGVLLARAARSARHRLNRSSRGQSGPASREALLATAERLKPRLCVARLGPHPDVRWPSGRTSFHEFLLQWPCGIEPPVELDDTAFIEEAYRAILLREPEMTERNQYIRLLRDGVASKVWIIPGASLPGAQGPGDLRRSGDYRTRKFGGAGNARGSMDVGSAGYA
jgi:hypothetical protein